MKTFTEPRPVNSVWSYGKRMAVYHPWAHLKNDVDRLVQIEMQSVRSAINLVKSRAARDLSQRLESAVGAGRWRRRR